MHDTHSHTPPWLVPISRKGILKCLAYATNIHPNHWHSPSGYSGILLSASPSLYPPSHTTHIRTKINHRSNLILLNKRERYEVCEETIWEAFRANTHSHTHKQFLTNCRSRGSASGRARGAHVSLFNPLTAIRNCSSWFVHVITKLSLSKADNNRFSLI